MACKAVDFWWINIEIARMLRPSLLLGELQVFFLELFPGLRVCGILGDAFHRANSDALRGVEVTDALGAATRVDDIDLHALGDGLIRALRLADVAIDAFVGDHQRHGKTPGITKRTDRLF